MEIYLIRHTTPAIEKGICYGQSDLDADKELFDEELNVIREKISNRFDAVYSSPLKRCAGLAGEISSNFVQDSRLQELDFGLWENKKWSELAGDELNNWMNDYVNTCAPAGESYLQLHARIKDFLTEILNKDYKRIAVISHAGCIRSFLSVLLGLPLENTFRIHLTHGAVIKASFNKDERLNKLISISNTLF